MDTTSDGRPWINKGGGSHNFASQLLYYPRDRVVIVWASNNLRQRWRKTLNSVLPDVVFDGESDSLPPVVRLLAATLQSRVGRYVTGRDTVEVRAGQGYLYVTANRLEVPTSAMYYPQGGRGFFGVRSVDGWKNSPAVR